MNRKELIEYLIQNGASKVGIANLSKLTKTDMITGISILVKIPKSVIKSIADGPNMDYYDQYNLINDKLDDLTNLGAEYIRTKGYEAIAQTTDYVKLDENYRTELPHKTVATMAGLGWIGKSALFITKEYGSAIRLTSILTNAELEYGEPITKSICGDCNLCVEACPGHAISGKLWDNQTDRDEILNPIKCFNKARQLSKDRMNIDITLCGKCIEVCPYTKGYLNNKKGEKYECL